VSGCLMRREAKSEPSFFPSLWERKSWGLLREGKSRGVGLAKTKREGREENKGRMEGCTLILPPCFIILPSWMIRTPLSVCYYAESQNGWVFLFLLWSFWKRRQNGNTMVILLDFFFSLLLSLPISLPLAPPCLYGWFSFAIENNK